MLLRVCCVVVCFAFVVFCDRECGGEVKVGWERTVGWLERLLVLLVDRFASFVCVLASFVCLVVFCFCLLCLFVCLVVCLTDWFVG